jgi:hypothetical protein
MYIIDVSFTNIKCSQMRLALLYLELMQNLTSSSSSLSILEYECHPGLTCHSATCTISAGKWNHNVNEAPTVNGGHGTLKTHTLTIDDDSIIATVTADYRFSHHTDHLRLLKSLELKCCE